ncbi:MAG TPA: response regulator [Verrucomicrobiae bacterium]|nr:response regulator [Verrucomicrobiae bacterium]
MEFIAHTQPSSQAAESRDSVSHDRRVRVLAIDDSNDFLTLLKGLLDPQGFEICPYTNPVKALEVFQRERDDYQLVLLDYYMPQLDGAKTFEWLRKLNPKVKVIVCSGAEELRLRQMQAQHPIDGYIHKPFRIQEALGVIHRVMGHQAFAVA